MDRITLYIILGLAAYFLLMIIIGINQGRKTAHRGFVIGARNVGILPTLGSLASGFRDGAGIVFWIGVAYTLGYATLWAILGALAGFSIYALAGPKARKIAKKHDYVTIGNMIRDRVGPITKKLTALLIVTFALLYMALQLTVSATIFATILDQPRWLGTVLVAIIVIFYLFAGGYGSVVKTDLIQFFLILGLILLPLFVPLSENAYDLSSFLKVEEAQSASYFLLLLCWPLASADNWQRVFSARNDRVIRVAFPLAGPVLIIMTLSMILLGYAAQAVLPAGLEADAVAFAMFEYKAFPAVVLAYIAVALVAICMSTLDTQSYLLTSTLIKDILPENWSRKRKEYIRLSKIILVTGVTIISVISLMVNDIVQALFEAGSLLFTLIPLYLLCALDLFDPSKKLDKMITGSLILSVGLYLTLFMSGLYDQNLLYLFLPVGLSILLIGGLSVLQSKTTFFSSQEIRQ